MAKSLTKLFLSTKNVFRLPKYVELRYYSNNAVEKQTLNITNVVAVNSKELIELLKSDINPVSILSHIETNKNIIDCCHIVIALRSMQEFYKSKQFSPPDVHNSLQFQKLCKILNSHLIRLSLNEVVESLKVLSSLVVPSTSMIMQSLLQLVRHSVNDLNLNQIYNMMIVLKDLKPTHLSEAICHALPEVFTAQLELALDREDIKELKKALRFASEHIYDDKKTIKFIIDGLNDCRENIDAHNAMRILWSLCNIRDLPNGYQNILFRVKGVLLNNINLLNQKEVMRTLSQILKKTLNGFDDFYDPFFIDKLVEKVVANNYGFDKGLFVLSKLNMILHINIPLIKYLASECYNDPMSFSKCPPQFLSVFVTGLAYANYKPLFWNELQEIILKNYKNTPDDVTLSYIALYLASLDCFNSKLIKYIFSITHKIELLTPTYHRTLQLFYQSIKALYPVYSRPWPAEELIQSFRTLPTFDETKDYPLLPSLEKLLGDPAYVKTKVKTSLGQDIDHLIVVQNESPIAIESTVLPTDINSFTYEEDLIIPPDTKRVAVLLLPPQAYGRNIKILQPSAVLNIKSLEAMSYTVVHISLDRWMHMPDFERIPYLQTFIGLKMKKLTTVN